MDARAEELIVKGINTLDRLAKANEQIVELATEERVDTVALEDFVPPHCPHCGAIDPECRSEGGSGTMSEFVLVAQCGECGNIFYGLPQGWHSLKTAAEAKEQLEGRTTE